MAASHESYLRDLGTLITEMELDAKREKEAASGSERYDVALGRLTALHEVVSLRQQQAEAFGLDLPTLAIDDISPERDLT